MNSKFSFIILLEKINIKIKIISNKNKESIFRTFFVFYPNDTNTSHINMHSCL